MLEFKLIDVGEMGHRATCCYANIYVFETETTMYSLSLKKF